MVFSVAYWCFFGLVAILLFPIALILRLTTMPYDPKGKLLHRFTCWWSRIYLRCLPGLTVDLLGRQNILPGRAYVLVANHQSLTDIMALSWLAVDFKWVSKKEAFRLPVIGWNMYLNQYVMVDRGNVRSVVETMKACRRWLDQGVSVMIFPEGHRSPDGELHDFHGGAFKLAVDRGCPVIPIVIDGTRPIYRGFRVLGWPGSVRMSVLDPITPDQAGQNALRLRDMAHERMVAELRELRRAPIDQSSIARSA